MKSNAANIPTDQMTEEEFFKEIKNSFVVLTTSSPDKRMIYEEMFALLGKETNHHGGVKFYHTDSGRLGLAPRKTDELENDYGGNLQEKWQQQLAVLRDPAAQEKIRLMLPGNEFDHRKIPIMGMTEDSGIELLFDNEDIKRKFIDAVTQKLKAENVPDIYLKKLYETGFPGPNLKPLQEHLTGGFNELMNMIYKAADEVGLKELRYKQTVKISFVSPKLNKHFPLTFESTGRLFTRNEYKEKKFASQKGDAINVNYVQIFDGQKEGTERTLDELIRDGLHNKSSDELPVDYARRKLVEYLQRGTDKQAGIGKRRSSRIERDRTVRVAVGNPDSMTDRNAGFPFHLPKIIRDIQFTGVPTLQELLHYPHMKHFGNADVIVLVPDNATYDDKRLRSNRNYSMLLKYLVTGLTDPEAMTVPIILDNRSRGFDDELPLITDGYLNGRSRGDKSFIIANTDDQLIAELEKAKDIKQRAPMITRIHVGEDTSAPSPRITKPERDGIFTVFVGGGHDNNADRDKKDGKAFGYYCAQQGWRIITGGGTIDGSMGSTHTGWIQFYLDQLQEKSNGGSNAFKARLDEYIGPDGKYDAEKIIKENPNLLDELADKNFIPRHLFYAYSMQPLLDMESHSGKKPPAVTFFEAGNRIRRLDGLLASGTKILLPGSTGTDEEFEDTVSQHLKARMNHASGLNDNTFADGTSDGDGTIIIYNRDHHLDTLLQAYGLSGNGDLEQERRKEYNVVIVDSLGSLCTAAKERESGWKNKALRDSAEPSMTLAV